jgi:hypothetical protein
VQNKSSNTRSVRTRALTSSDPHPHPAPAPNTNTLQIGLFKCQLIEFDAQSTMV